MNQPLERVSHRVRNLAALESKTNPTLRVQHVLQKRPLSFLLLNLKKFSLYNVYKILRIMYDNPTIPLIGNGYALLIVQITRIHYIQNDYYIFFSFQCIIHKP